MKVLGLALAILAVFNMQECLTLKQSDKLVVCYFSSWAHYREDPGHFDVAWIDPTLCTHGMYAYADIDTATWSLMPVDPWYDLGPMDCGIGECNFDSYRRFTALASETFTPMLSVGGYTEGPQKFSDMARDPVKRQAFIDSSVDYLQRYGFKGLDIDWEFPGEDDKRNLDLLVGEMKAAFDLQGLTLSLAIFPEYDRVDLGYDIPFLSENADFLSIISYDYHSYYNGHEFTAHDAPMFRINDEEDITHPGYGYNVYDGVRYILQKGGDPTKLILGVPAYGNGFMLEDASNNGLYCPAVGAINPGPIMHSSPDTPPGCGEGWVCEHRWNSIGNMVEFANAVNGEPVENWVGEADMVAFSRGAKGFYAMGNVGGREFATGLPDGEYCDLISDCVQKITISGGMGTFDLYDSEEPAVAICVGCSGGSGPGTTSAPDDDATTTTQASTSPVPEECCDTITLSSSGAGASAYPELMGDYSKVDTDENGRGVYQHKTILTDAYISYVNDPAHHWDGWRVTNNRDEVFGFISNDDDGDCPQLASGWDYLDGEDWNGDETMKVSCNQGGGDTTTSPGGGGSTNAPPTGMARTIIFIERETFPGSDVFIVGGINDEQRPDCGTDAETSTCAIDIALNEMPKQWESYNAWMEGDTKLDWEGPQVGQGTFDDYEAFGTPGAWTTDDATDDFYYELNTFGPHYWIIDMNMDCSQTENGWFELNTLYTIGGEDGEPIIAQEACTGGVGGTAPYSSPNHMARCGYMNVFQYGEDGCQIDDVPAKN